MIIPDVNLLIYAYNTGAPLHSRARQWWDHCLRGPEAIGLPSVVLLAFIRINTLPRLHRHPMTSAQALQLIEEWLTLPHYHLVHPAPDHYPRLRVLLQRYGHAGNLTTDAHLAALAMEQAAILHTSDADFARFPGLKWVNPLTAAGGVG